MAKEPSSSWKVRGSTENFLQNAFLLIAYFRVTHITEAISQQGHWVSSTLRLSWPSLQFATPLPSSQNSPKTLLYRNIKTAISKLKINYVTIHRKVTVSWKCLPGNGFHWSSIGIHTSENKTFLSSVSGALPYLSSSLPSLK